MSLINKMLQDLDARGTAAGEAYPMPARPVAREERAVPLRAVAVAAGIAVAGAAGWFAWQQYASRPAAMHVPVPVQANAPVSAPAAVADSRPVTAPPAQAVQAAPAVPVAPEAELPAPVAHEAAPARAPAAPTAATAATPAPSAAPDAPRGKTVEPMEPDSPEAREARRVMTALLAARQPAPAPAPTPKAAARAAAAARPSVKDPRPTEPQARQAGGSRLAEAAYRRALERLQDGRIGESLAALEETLRIDPGHDAARQTLVGLLIEDGRPDEAVRQLELGLARDPRQPALAMLLARLQIERGGSGIETLMRTLPHAGNDPDYHAFLGGALERQQRHRDAAEHYLVAVRGMPANGVWWMGLGIALQGDRRNADALDAFRKARASGTLTAELAAFVERRIQQLGG
ncbi:tetratricopeptide repeat protein [Massilia sp. TN1-12]|uniref:tetratricopeptide repeat protein n=1 Tax=Massilia paldalensis TaxID=3377675 RepID=UPI00384A92C7